MDNISRHDAVMCLIGAIKGASLDPRNTPEQETLIINANLMALMVLGVHKDEINAAIMGAPFLDVPSQKGRK